MPQLIVIVDQLPYGGVVFRKGDKFFASDEDARLLKGFSKAADLTDDNLNIKDEPRQKRSYRRRDMKAER